MKWAKMGKMGKSCPPKWKVPIMRGYKKTFEKQGQNMPILPIFENGSRQKRTKRTKSCPLKWKVSYIRGC